VSPERPSTVASPPLPEVASDVGLERASPVSPEDDDAPVVVSLDPDVAELSDEDRAVASPELAAASAAARLPETAEGRRAPALPDVTAPEVAPAPVSPGPEVAVLAEPLVELAGPVSPPCPVELDDDEPEEPEPAEPDDEELAGPEFPPVESPVTSPESPLVTSTAMPPVPPPEPPPVPPLLAPESPVVPDVPSALAPPPSPVDAVAPPSDVASPVSPLEDDDDVVVVDDPELAPESEDESDDESPLAVTGSSTVRITLAEVCGVSWGSMEAIRAAKAIFSSMARSVLSAVTSGDGTDGQRLLAPVLRYVT
jgi:hypothetical protein